MIVDIFNTTMIVYVIILVKQITLLDRTVKLSKFAVRFQIAMFGCQAIVSCLYTTILFTKNNQKLQNRLQYVYVLVCNVTDFIICI